MCIRDRAFGAHARSHPGGFEKVGDAVLDDARAHAVLHVLEAAGLDDDGVDALALQQVTEHQSSRTGADDHHLRAN